MHLIFGPVKVLFIRFVSLIPIYPGSHNRHSLVPLTILYVFRLQGVQIISAAGSVQLVPYPSVHSQVYAVTDYYPGLLHGAVQLAVVESWSRPGPQIQWPFTSLIT